jgi:hypothetical protein
MQSMISFGVQYPEYDDAISLHSVEELVRKAMRNQSAKTVIIDWALFGTFGKKTNGALNLVQQFIPKTGTPRIIPRLRLV